MNRETTDYVEEILRAAETDRSEIHMRYLGLCDLTERGILQDDPDLIEPIAEDLSNYPEYDETRLPDVTSWIKLHDSEGST